MTASIKEAYILITDKELEDIYEFLDFVEKVLKPQKEKGLPTQNLVVIANDIKGTLLASMVATKQKGMMNLLGIKAPAFGQYKKELMEDLAVMTGGKFVDADSHVRLGELKFEVLGYADVVKCTRETTTIIGNKGEIKDINARIEGIKNQLDDPESEYNEEKLRERLSKMTGGVYVIKTGGGGEKEVEEKRERVDDAILATKSAILHGIVPGGEVAFLKILDILKTKDQEEEYAFRILKSALTKPFEKLLSNAGLDAGYYKAKLEDKSFGYGVNVVSGQIEDLVKSGIIDPTEVLVESIISAVSVAVLLLTSDGFSTIVEKENK
jgi:chaperonin GroEL